MTAIPEEQKKDTHYTKEGMDRRMKEYKDRNDEAQGNIPLINFFKKRGIDVLILKAESVETEQQKAAEEYLEKVNSIPI